METNSYEVVLSDLENEKLGLLQQINRIDDAIQLLKSLNKTIVPPDDSLLKDGDKLDDTFSNRTRPGAEIARRTTNITLIDGSEQILRKVGHAMHIDQIVKELEALGRLTTKRSLNSTLIQDSKKRFHLLGKYFFDLSSRAQPQTLFNDGSYLAKTVAEPSEFSLIGAVRDEIKALEGRKFEVLEIYNALHEKFPNEVDESRRRSVGSTINNLMLKGELEKVRVGSFDMPALYRAMNNG
jgi:hypothetical protein